MIEPLEAATPRVMSVHVADGKDVLVGDLPIHVLREIAKRHGEEFMHLLIFPLSGDGAAAEDIFRACCDLAKVDAPETITAQELYDAFEAVPTDPTKRATTVR